MLAFLSFMSCNSIYLPNSQNVPLFEKANDFQITGQGQIYVPSFTYGFQGQVAYSFSNHIGALANYGITQTQKSANSQSGEFALGYYNNKIGQDNFSVFIGSGMASASATEMASDIEIHHLKSDYKTYFIQPCYGFHQRRSSLSFSMKMLLVDSKDTIYDPNLLPSTSHSLSWHFEPAFTAKVKLGNSPLQFVGQAGLHLTDYQDLSFFRNFARLAVGFQWKLRKKPTE